MAYREFYEPSVINTEATYQGIGQGLSNLFRTLAEQQKQKKLSADQFQYDLDQGSYENDTRILGEVAKNVTDRAKSEYRSAGRLSPDTQRVMIDGKTWQQQSKNQFERAKQLAADIRGKTDPYYNPEPDLNLVKWATHGENNDVDFRTRGERLQEAEKKLGGVDTFRFDKYRADWVKTQGQASKKNEFPMKNGSSRTIYDQATFWDDKTGKPGVTDDHAIRFIQSDRRVAEFYDNLVGKQLNDEIKAMKSSGDARTAWMKGLSDEEIKNQLINDPSKNLINQQNYGSRVRDTAKKDLSASDKINSEVSYTAVPADQNNSNGRWKNPNILITDSVNTIAQEAKGADGKMSTVTAHGPGGRIVQKSGKAVQIDTMNPVRTNIKTGVTTTKNKGSVKLNLTGYQLIPFKSTGAPFLLKGGSTTEEMISAINNIPLDHFDPNGKMKLKPELQLAMNGYVIDEAGVLNDVQDQLLTLSEQIQEATKNNDAEKLASLQNMEMNLNDLKEMVGSGDYDPQQLLLAGNKAGVRKIQMDMLLPMDDSDYATVRNITGGFNLKDKSTWSEEMRIVDEAYRKRAAEAKEKGYGKNVEADKKPKKITPEEFNAQWATLKVGQKLVGPDGKTYIKK